MNVVVYENGVPTTYSGVQLQQIIEQVEGICNHTPELPYKFKARMNSRKQMIVSCSETPIPEDYFHMKVRVKKPFQRVDLFGSQIRIAPAGTWPFDMRVEFTPMSACNNPRNSSLVQEVLSSK